MSFRSVLAVCGLVLLVPVTAAHAGTVTAPNSCKYSYDGFFRDTGVTLTGAAAITPDTAHPAPTQVVPGMQVKLSGAKLHFQFPSTLAQFGYQVGLLDKGDNTIDAKVWVAVKATNTKEKVRVVGPLTVQATTSILVDETDGDRFISATDFTYTDPTLPDLTWTATGGDVKLSQGDAGSLPGLPVGPSGANRVPVGSAVIQANLNGANFVMDCAPGNSTGVNPTDGAGPDFVAAPADPISTVQGPLNVTCLSDPGRQVSGAAANLPTGVTRELDWATASLSAAGAPATFNGAYTLSGAKLHLVLSADTIATLGRFQDGGTALVTPDHPYPLNVWVTIAGSNTTEGTRTVAAVATYTPHPTEPVTGTSAWAPADVTIDLPDTQWTPTGAGPIAFSAAQPGLTPALDVVGPATGGPGGTVVSTTFSTSPYGDLLVRAGTDANQVSLDCVPGVMTVANSGIAWSNRGRLAAPDGSAGRYALDVVNPLATFHTATDATVKTDPTPTPTATATPDAKVPDPTPTAAPIVIPTPVPIIDPPAPTAKLTIGSTKLKADRKGRTTVQLTCASAACSGALQVKSAAKVKVGKTKKTVTVTTKQAVRLAAGKRLTLTLTLSRDAKSVLKARKQLVVVVTYTPKSGKAVTRRLTLR